MNAKKLVEDAILPERKLDSAGYDLHSTWSGILPPMVVVGIPTGIAVEIPPKHVGVICDRSGLASKGITTAVERVAMIELIKWLGDSDDEYLGFSFHPIGRIIDDNYRGEIKVLVVNVSGVDFEIKKGERIAQLLVWPLEAKPYTAAVKEVKTLTDTNRGTSGFGSTG